MKTLRQLAPASLAVIGLLLGMTSIAQAQVKVTSATPSSTYQGTVSLDVVIAGSGFDNTSKAQFVVSGSTNPGGITVRKTVFHNSKEVVATIDVADTATIASFDVIVALDDGRKGKGTSLFAVKDKQADPCFGAQGRGFPSLSFGRQMSVGGVNGWYALVADASGQCERVVASVGAAIRDVELRYDTAAARGVLIDSNASTIYAATFSVTFDTQGVPTTQSGAFSPILTKSDVPTLPDLQSAGWTLSDMYPNSISPDGSALVFVGYYDNPSVGPMLVHWLCSFASTTATVDPASCHAVRRAAPDSGSMKATWGARVDSLYFVTNADSGSGTALHRLRLSDGSFTQVWSLGTLFTGARAALDSTGHERVAVYEGGGNSGCAKVWVIDADSCSGNSCTVLNGQGNPARSLTWLPDGRIAGEGQTAPNRRGQCSADGSIVTFNPTDTTGTSTTLIKVGANPDGSGGG